MEKLTVLEFLCSQFGWQGGTIHQAIQELKDRCNSELGYFKINHLIHLLSIVSGFIISITNQEYKGGARIRSQ